MSVDFIHLKVHTEFSLVDGLVRVADLVSQVKEKHMPAVAVTDVTNLYGLIKFYKKAQGVGIIILPEFTEPFSMASIEAVFSECETPKSSA